MTAPDCADHGTLVLEYVRGNLDDAEGLRAETAVSNCQDCRTWLDTHFSGPAFAVVEGAVSESLQTTHLPQRRHRFSWLAAAAAILVIAGGLTVIRFPDQSTPGMLHQRQLNQSALIGAFDFEEGNISNPADVLEDSSSTTETIDPVETDPLFSDGLENGEPGSWTFHT